jgi:hypothetical protein
MSLVVIANTTSNQEQFGRFIDELKGIVASYNSSLESAEASGTKVDLNAFITKARTLLDQDNLSGLLSHIVNLGSPLVNDPKSALSIFYILALLCNKIQDKTQQLNSIRELVQYVAKKSDATVGLKFKLLAILFNSFGNEDNLRFEVFASLLTLADETNRPNVLLTHLSNIDEYITQWNLSKENQLKLLTLAVKLISKCDDKLYREKYQFFSKYLRVLDALADAKANQDQAENLKIILKTALNHFPYEIDISTFLDLKPVQEIAKIDKDLYDLFVVAVEGNLTSFEQWKQSRSAYLTANKIEEERVLDRVRLKSIFQEVQKNKVLKLKEIEKLLKLSEDEVEFWIIKVHQEGHIRGKIDQLEGTLYIDGIIDDSFKSSEWKDLETNLELFRKNYEGYIEKLRSERSK